MKQIDIADALNISTSTVSRVLGRNDTRSISEDLKHRIITMAIENGIKIKTKKYGILIGSFRGEQPDDPFFGEIINHAAKAFQEMSYYRCFHCTAPELEKMSDAEMIEHYGQLDGVIIIAMTRRSIIDRIAKLTSNIVHIGEVFAFNEISNLYTELDDYPYDQITFDSYNLIIQCVEYLVSLGRKKIIFVSMVNENIQRNARTAGYLEGMSRTGLAGRVKIVFSENFGFDGGYNIANEIYKKTDFDAVICHSDQIALGLMEKLISLGAKIPDDIMVIGFNDIAMASCKDPPLTTVRVDTKGIGYLSAMIINARVEKLLSAPVMIRTKLELVKRKSTGDAGYQKHSQNSLT